MEDDRSSNALDLENGLGENNTNERQTGLSLQIRGLHKGYPGPTARLEVLVNLDFECKRGETVAIVGASGVGKSTLLHVMGALDEPDRGEIRVADVDPFSLDETERARLRNREVGFVFQFHHLLREFTGAENVALPLWVSGTTREEATDRADTLLGELGLAHRSGARPDELSGGERQRVAIARAIVTSPSLLLADEPTGDLDRETARMVYEKMLELTRSRDTALVVATHDLELAAQADRVLRLVDGTLEPA
jgi:lipoprotein-releasing system ATP-binding protein